jgi:hypothetical protein
MIRRRFALAFVLLAAAPAAAEEFKGPAPGSWRTIIDGDAANPRTICIENQESLDNFLDGDDLIEVGIECGSFKFRREGEKVIGSYICRDKDEGVTMTSDVTFKGDLSRSYTSEIVTRFEPPPAPGYETVTTKATNTRIGAC